MLKRYVSLILFFLAPMSSVRGSQVSTSEFERPNVTVLEMQLRENETLLFGKVIEVEQKVKSHLVGFQTFKVKMEVDELWSKKVVKPKPHYSFEFGTMIDQTDMQKSLPVKRNERLVIVLDSYRPNEERMLKDHMLSIYEHHHDKTSGKDYYISKLTKHYNQKSLVFSELQRVAYLEKMNIFSIKDKDKSSMLGVTRSIASEASSLAEFPGPNSLEMAEPSSNIKRRPNSSFSNQDEEFSVFSLLLVLVFLAVFSHFVIKYYETPDEEI